MISDTADKMAIFKTLALARLTGRKCAGSRASARGRVWDWTRMPIACEAVAKRGGKRELQVSFDSYRRSCVIEDGPEYFNKESEL